MSICPYCWPNHGCDLAEGHEDNDHKCLAVDDDGEFEYVCDSRPRGHADVFHYADGEPEVMTP